MTKKKRLQVLYNYLTSGAVDEEKFDMGHWPTCAIGEAARIPSLIKEGLGFDECHQPVYGWLSSFEAVSDFFGLKDATAEQVFGTGDRSVKVVAAQIKRLL